MSSLTSAEEVLLAAAKISNYSQNEFTEWELTVATWKLNKNKWGLRGFENIYPDHKRVMNEIMAKGTQKTTGKGWIERTRPNYYRLTSSGAAKAMAISSTPIEQKQISFHQFNALEPYIYHNVFQKYLSNPDEPKTWLGAAAFLGVTGGNPEILDRTMGSIQSSINESLDWMHKNNENALRRSDGSKLITIDDINKLQDFLNMLESRFKPQFDAIRAKRV